MTQPAPVVHNINRARDNLASTVATRRRERATLWQDSGFFQDSFFAPDSRLDAYAGSDFSTLSPTSGRTEPDSGPAPLQGGNDDIAGVVVDTPRYSSSTRH